MGSGETVSGTGFVKDLPGSPDLVFLGDNLHRLAKSRRGDPLRQSHVNGQSILQITCRFWGAP
jgi:hypothetical protein